ncbi:membrane protein insertion efficiency factor YidD [Calothrix sp. 336/3]|uniref:membrane protein insertion efficiency factor YidD n=1 Tax=Calothrix sp. 336/3 TaxID=1337936 RepID=UPI0004E4537E|nr:membrane protein insertion efficiency factor YidD [Calothrix sp. 336/3]AKG20922.1 hypothetical protein IJ00_06070 [Calothrix sp. 336/3]
MQAYSFDSLSRNFTVTAISGYQKFISPHKGFSCAHRVLYGGESCSQYIKRAIANYGISIGLEKARSRFDACKQANLILHSQREELEEEPEDDENVPTDGQKMTSKPRKTHFADNCPNCNQPTPCVDASCECLNTSADITDCVHSDCILPDCNGFDCGILDCGTLDCGSCSF